MACISVRKKRTCTTGGEGTSKGRPEGETQRQGRSVRRRPKCAQARPHKEAKGAGNGAQGTHLRRPHFRPVHERLYALAQFSRVDQRGWERLNMAHHPVRVGDEELPELLALIVCHGSRVQV